MHELGRLLLEIRRKVSELRSATLTHIIVPKHFQAVVVALQAIAGYNDSNHSYKKPSLAMKLDHSVKRCAFIEMNNAAHGEDDVVKRRAKAFAQLCASEWTDEISGDARRNLEDRRFNKPKLLPLTSDVIKMVSYLKELIGASGY